MQSVFHALLWWSGWFRGVRGIVFLLSLSFLLPCWFPLTYTSRVVGTAFSWHEGRVHYMKRVWEASVIHQLHPAYFLPMYYPAVLPILTFLLVGLHQTLGCVGVTTVWLFLATVLAVLAVLADQ